MDAYQAAVFGAAGIPAGAVLSLLVERLAVPFDDDDEGGGRDTADAETETEPDPNRRLTPAGAEAGSLTLAAPAAASVLRRLVIVAATAGLFALAGARFDTPWQAAVVCAYIAVLVVCAATDLLVYRVPDAITYPGMLLALAVGLAAPGFHWRDMLLGGALAGGLLLVPAIITGGQMGMGDVKLATFGGLALGWKLVLPALVVMGLSGGIGAAALLLLGRRSRREAMPYAPYVALGILVALLVQGTVFQRLT